MQSLRHIFLEPWYHDELAYKVAYNFKYMFWNTNHLVMIFHLVRSSIFRKYFTWFGGLDPKSRPFLIYQYAAINQITVSLTFFTLWQQKIMSNMYYKLTEHIILLFYQNHKGPETSFQS